MFLRVIHICAYDSVIYTIELGHGQFMDILRVRTAKRYDRQTLSISASAWQNDVYDYRRQWTDTLRSCDHREPASDSDLTGWTTVCLCA